MTMTEYTFNYTAFSVLTTGRVTSLCTVREPRPPGGLPVLSPASSLQTTRLGWGSTGSLYQPAAEPAQPVDVEEGAQSQQLLPRSRPGRPIVSVLRALLAGCFISKTFASFRK